MIENKNIYKGNENPNTESKKLDSNGEEIVWELRSKKVGFFITLLHLIFFSLSGFLLVFKGIEKYLNRNDTDFFMTLLLLFCAMACFSPFYRLLRLLNQKDVYITRDTLFIEKYLGKNIISPLGVSYIKTDLIMWGAIILGMSSKVSFCRIDVDNYPTISFFTPFLDNTEYLYVYLLPKIEAYLIELQEKEYIECKIILNIDGKMDSRIDFDKIERLRKEKENAK